ncbi:PaaI family thioesterase [Pikeienuella piscinae]|uniref:PaaI family thioesterase n=1 Tax=Pikeienuella piscinae TaxID=2748098 RepID=A0A7M3T665_9RHOB|nr:PaaI family thioesterase [Pikeienuella piscinae]QIE57496.1 PaaI family thioesterase [Pikeienuella piscinae]
MSRQTSEPIDWNARFEGCFPGLVGLRLRKAEPDEVIGVLDVRKALFAPNGYLHAGAVVTLADTCCGVGALRTLPDGATGFTTIDLSSNFLSTAREGKAICSATPLHLGRRTQVWDAAVTSTATGRPMAQFRCTQMVLWPKG